MFTLPDILQGTNGRLDNLHLLGGPNPPFHNITIDSRQAAPSALFFAIKGERSDGHNYVLNALGQGADGAVVRHDWPTPDEWPPHAALIRVDDPLSALQRLAAWWSARHNVQVIGITGSVGKTTTKEVVAAVLSTQFNTLKSEGNLNNEIGLPLTLLRLTPDHQKAVLEMGAGYELGELTTLCAWAKPEIAVVTMVEPVHLERMKTIERIALNKSELVRALPPTGMAVLNGDDPLVRGMGAVTAAKVLYYGVADDRRRTTDDGRLDIYATGVESRGLEGVQFTLHFGQTGEGWPVHLPLLGAHNVYTALAAAGVGLAVGMTPNEIADALTFQRFNVPTFLRAFQRIKLVPGVGGSTLIDDCYNAAPASMLAALDLLSETPGRRIAVLGDMLELGSQEEAGHKEVGRRAREVANYIVAVGNLGKLIGEAALQAGIPVDKVMFAATNAQAIDHLKPMLQPGDHALIKGSRGLHMEDIVEGLKVEG